MSQRTAKPLVVELFAGAGGLGLGFELAGFTIGVAIEQAPYPAATYRLNHPHTAVVENDIQKLNPLKCVRDAGIDPAHVDAVICGLPCQGFSESNRRTRTLTNPRNHLYKDFIRFVAALRPRCIMIENVAGMQTMAGGKVINRIVKECQRLGFSMCSFELNAVDFGVPQLRRRLFLVGSLDGPLSAPGPSHGIGRKEYVTVRYAISDLPILRPGSSIDQKEYRETKELSDFQRLMRKGVGKSGLVSGHSVTRNNGLVLERYRFIGPGQNWEAIPIRLMANYTSRTLCHTGLYYRLVWDEPSKVVGNFRKNMLIHPSQNRGLSIREAARLQSFPDRYTFLGPMGDRQQQVADAVPPLLAKAVGTVVAKSLV